MMNDLQSIAASSLDGISQTLDRAAAVGLAHLTHGLSTVTIILAVIEVMKRAEDKTGSWLAGWSAWLTARSGAPTAHPAMDAPGPYVLEK